MQRTIPITPILFIIVLLLSCLDSITAYIYLPALPAITKNFGVNHAAIQLTLSIFLFGIAFSHLIYGPLSDRFGRRSPLFFGIGFSLAGTILCFLSPSVFFLGLGRLMEGIGVGACNTISRSIARDLLSGNALAKFFSQIGMAVTVMAGGAVALGGVIEHFFGWRAIFLILTIYSLLVLIFSIKALPETNQYINPNAIKIKIMLQNYFTLLRSHTFLGFTLSASFANAGLAIYNVSAPYVLQNVVGLTSAQFGALSLLIALAIFISAFMNNKAVLKKGMAAMNAYGTYLLLAGGIIMLIFALLGFINTFVIMFPVLVFVFGLGFILVNSIAGGFNLFPEMAGAASALYGTTLMLASALGSALASLLPTNNQFPLAISFIILGVLSLLSFKLTEKQSVIK